MQSLQLTGVPCCGAHTRRDGNLCAGPGLFPLLPATLLAPPSRRSKGSPGPRIRAAVARLTRRNRGAEHLSARTGATPRAGMGEGETPASLVPRTIVRLLIHSQNRSRKGGREERLEEERMEEEREEGSVGRGLQDPPPGSLEMPQPSARLPALDAAPARLEEPVGVRRAPMEPRAPASSAQPPCGPPLQSGRRGPGSPCRRSPTIGCSAGPRRLHAPPPAPRRRRTSLPGAPPPPRAPTDERRPRRGAFKYRARPRRERRPPPAQGPGKLGRVGGLPRGP